MEGGGDGPGQNSETDIYRRSYFTTLPASLAEEVDEFQHEVHETHLLYEVSLRGSVALDSRQVGPLRFLFDRSLRWLLG
jgi:hypothetical protein